GFITDYPAYDDFYLDSVVYCEILPVTWLSFLAQIAGPDKSMLTWVTTDEINVDEFEVQRSFDGRNYEPIGYVKAHNEFDSVHEYAYMDKGPLWGKVYYRLKQYDLDGKFTYSAIRAVHFSPGSFSVKVQPNPVKDNISVKC